MRIAGKNLSKSHDSIEIELKLQFSNTSTATSLQCHWFLVPNADPCKLCYYPF